MRRLEPGTAGAAAGVAAGAALALPVPLPVPLAAVAAGLVARRAALVAAGLALLASGMAHTAWHGLAAELPTRWDGVVTLGSDPEPQGRGVRVEVIAGGRRYQAAAYGPSAGPLRSMQAGERIELHGRVGPLPPDRPDLARKHLAGRIEVEGAGLVHPAAAVHRVANAIRDLVGEGLAHLPEARRALVTGVVFGDDRYQARADRDAFRDSGLSHLLAVSGQNVAFVLAVAGPLLGRLTFRTRLPFTAALLLLFGLVTRFEPSVLRAVCMAGFSALAVSRGREASGMRVLGLAVITSLLVDPLLVGSLGFQLSVLASAGILVMAAPVAAAIPGPRALATPVSVTLAAQLAVAPLLVGTFGAVPVVSIPANLLAAPAAGPLMMWGLVGGLCAGVTGGGAARLLHLPTEALAGWLTAVAHGAAALPLGGLGPVHVAALWVAALVLVRTPEPWARRLAVAAAVLILLHAAVLGPEAR